MVDEDTSISTSPENVDHSEIPKQPQLNLFPAKSNPDRPLSSLPLVLDPTHDQSSSFHPLENPFFHSLRIDTLAGKSIEIIVFADFNIFLIHFWQFIYFIVRPIAYYAHSTNVYEICKEKKLLEFSLSLSLNYKKFARNSKFSG